MVETILKLDNISKSFGKFEVLKNINLEIPPGEIFGIIGPSGSGKTTFLNVTAGFVPPTKGNALFRLPHLLEYESGKGEVNKFRSVIKFHDEIKNIIGFASQEPSFYGQLTLIENLDLFGSLYGLSADARETNSLILLKLMGLYEYRKNLAKNLSGGMQKRLDIACALIHDPKVLVLDEPTADLDPHLRHQMWSLIKKINSKGTTIILSSHFLDELEDMCDRVGILYNHQLTHVGSPAELKQLISCDDQIHIQTLKGDYNELTTEFSPHEKYHITHIEDMGTELEIHTKHAHGVIEHMLKVLDQQRDVLVSLQINRPTLNQVFENLIIQNENHKHKSRKKKDISQADAKAQEKFKEEQAQQDGVDHLKHKEGKEESYS
jgi:ABC-2 type transport system ATP-binding protein